MVQRQRRRDQGQACAERTPVNLPGGLRQVRTTASATTQEETLYGAVTLAATLLVATVSGLIVLLAPRLEQRDIRRAAHGERDREASSP